MDTSNLYNQHLKLKSKLFNITTIAILLFGVGFTGFLFNTGGTLFYSGIELVFDKIPYVGHLFYYYTKSMNIINFDVFYRKAFLPILSVEALYFAILLCGFTLVAYFLKRTVLKKDHAFVSALLLIIIQVSLVMTVKNSLLLTRTIDHNIYSLKNTFITLIMLFQFGLTIFILRDLAHLKRFNLSHLFTDDNAFKIIKKSSIVLITVFAIIGIGLLVAKSQVVTLKKMVEIEYILDLKPTADGLVHLNVPPKITNVLTPFGIKLPQTITGSLITDQFGITELDVGNIVNEFTGTRINMLTYRLIQIPTINTFTALALVIGTLVSDYYIKKDTIYKKLLIHTQFIISFVLFFLISKNFGMIINIISGLLFFASLIHEVIILRTTPWVVNLIKAIKLKFQSLQEH